MKDHQHILIIGYVWPEPDSSAAGKRMMELIHLFEQSNWEITFASAAAESEHMADLDSLGISQETISVNDSSFDDFISMLQPDAVMFDRFVTEEQFGWRVAEECPGALRILDTEDLHFLRRARHNAVKDGRVFSKEDLLSEDTTKREIASIYRCDLSLIISEFERNILTDFFGINECLLCYMPFLLDEISEEEEQAWSPFSGRSHFITIGNFRHPPNWDAIRYLREQIWPLIRKQLPKVEFHAYGAYVSQKAIQLHNPDVGFYIEGRADNARAVMESAKICLAPLRFGAGLKGKLIEAMQSGTPSVTTTIGAEGLAEHQDWPGAVRDAPEQFAFAAVELYSNAQKWSRAQQRGRPIINSRFAHSDHGQKFMNQLDSIAGKVESHRRGNFVGQMLMHHTAASTKYMSRWIEEKNR